MNNNKNILANEVVQNYSVTPVSNEKKSRGKSVIFYSTKIVTCLVCSFILLCISIYLFLLFSNRDNSVSFFSSSNVRDIVHLKENNYFSTPTLEDKGKYISSLIDRMELDFYYEFKAKDQINYIYSYYIEANTIIKDAKDGMIIWNEKETLVSSLKSEMIDTFSISERVVFDFQKYNDKVFNFIKDYVVIGEGELQIALYVKLLDTSTSDVILSEIVPVTISLNNQTTNVKKQNISNTSSILLYSSSISIDKVVFLVMAIISILISIFLIIKGISLFKSIFLKRSLYQKHLDNILKTYDSIIVEVNELPDYHHLHQIIVSSFEELLDAQEELRAPIIYREIVIDKRGIFIIIKNDDVWIYQLDAKNL